MKNKKIFNILAIAIVAILTGTITAYATTYLYNSSEISYNNQTSGISATNVQAAVDELYASANNYSTMQSLVTTVTSDVQTYSSGITVTAYKVGKVVYGTISGELTAALSTNAGYVNIATLSEGFRPVTKNFEYKIYSNDCYGQLTIYESGVVRLGYTKSISSNAAIDLTTGKKINMTFSYIVP